MAKKTQRWANVRDQHIGPADQEENRRWAERELLELDLQQLREHFGLTQQQVAKASEMAQSALSRAEKGADHRISTLRRIVEALGGELELVVKVGDERVVLDV